MTTISRATEREAGARTRRSLALAVADANWFTTENLFRELDRDHVSTLLLTCIDYRNAWCRGHRPWSWNKSARAVDANLWRQDLVLPSGWMKQYPRLGMRPIRRAIRRWRAHEGGAGPLALVMTYPHYVFLRELLQPEVNVYLNVDDYALYWPKHAQTIRALEARAVLEADLTVCTSHLRALSFARPCPRPRIASNTCPTGHPRAPWS